MSSFTAKTDNFKRAYDNCCTVKKDLSDFGESLNEIRCSLTFNIEARKQINKKLLNQQEALSNLSKKTEQFGLALNNILRIYVSNEQKLSGITKERENNEKDRKNKTAAGVRAGEPGSDHNIKNSRSAESQNNENRQNHRISGRKAEGSVKSGSAEVHSGIIGAGAAYGFLNGKAETKGGFESKYKNGRMEEASISVSGEVEGSFAKGSLEGNIGIAKGKVKGDVGKVSAKGEIGATLYEDGKLSPSIGFGAEAKATAASGEISTQLGSDENNINIKGQGSAGVAKAEASAKAGVITYKDSETGESKQGFGVSGDVGAEAYLAEGSVSGGVTIFGIKIKAKVTGKAGGAGIGAEGHATTGGVSGEIKAGLGIGAGIKLEIDWSDFKPKWPWQR